MFGKGISTCAICDGSLYKDCDVAVIGGGNSAVSEAAYLSNICNKVYIIKYPMSVPLLIPINDFFENNFQTMNITIKLPIETKYKIIKQKII